MSRAKKAIVVLAALALVAAVGAPAADAQVRRYSRGYAGAIDLTDEQLERIEDLRLAFQKEILELETKWRKIDLELEALSLKGQDMDAKLKELDGLEVEMDKKWEEQQAKVRSVLTEEQKVLFDRYGGLGLGPGPGGGYLAAPRWGLRPGAGRGLGYGYAPGAGRGVRGYGRYSRYGRGYGAGMGRGYYCPWRRW
jgi:hypothetical protein